MFACFIRYVIMLQRQRTTLFVYGQRPCWLFCMYVCSSVQLSVCLSMFVTTSEAWLRNPWTLYVADDVVISLVRMFLRRLIVAVLTEWCSSIRERTLLWMTGSRPTTKSLSICRQIHLSTAAASFYSLHAKKKIHRVPKNMWLHFLQ